MNSMVDIDKRRNSRISECVCVWLSFPRDGAAYSTLTNDLSPQGARFCALRRVNVDERVHIHIQMPAGNIGCEGKVCWVRPTTDGNCTFGVRFVALAQYERDYLERYLGKASLL